MKKFLFFLVTHGFAIAIGFAAGVYFLPILTAPPAPSADEVKASVSDAQYAAEFTRDLAGSDALHWGDGQVSVGRTMVAFEGRLAPGPDYRLYLVPEFVETEEQFLRVKDQAAEVGPVKTFENFLVSVPSGVDIDRYDTVLVWCEAFGEFITAARYR